MIYLTWSLELVIATALFFTSLVACIIVTNKFTRFLTSNESRHINVLVLILHLSLIVACVIAIRTLFFKYIKNKNMLNGIFSLTGPIIGLSSLYMSDTLHALVGSI